MKKRVAVVIPARMASSRFPGKPLVRILDLPMLEHVRRRALLADAVDDVYVATCDREIMKMVHKFGGKAIMTGNTHERCTDRVKEAAQQISAEIIVIVQGDEPLFNPQIINNLVDPILFDEEVYCTNLLSLIKNRENLDDIDIVKAVINNKQNVMFFSRSAIPYFRVYTNAPFYRQTGVSAFTHFFLSKYTNLEPTPLEVIESIDFLRILEHAYSIRGVISSQETFGVDRKDDIKIIEKIIQDDSFQKEYYDRILSL
jgi:3-deoxy-manno-octulosonate cytidylyltransferase (CMP-KDO synthetase)